MDELRHANGQQTRSPTRRGQLFATLVACATGMGYTRMAEASTFTERQLREAAERHCTIEHLAAADAVVCEAIRGLAQTTTIDLERISSSDGQHYPIIGRSALAGFAAREAGYRRRMVTWMIWINEQYAHFGAGSHEQVIAAAVPCLVSAAPLVGFNRLPSQQVGGLSPR
jgi:hypothetical protein